MTIGQFIAICVVFVLINGLGFTGAFFFGYHKGYWEGKKDGYKLGQDIAEFDARHTNALDAVLERDKPTSKGKRHD